MACEVRWERHAGEDQKDHYKIPMDDRWSSTYKLSYLPSRLASGRRFQLIEESSKLLTRNEQADGAGIFPLCPCGPRVALECSSLTSISPYHVTACSGLPLGNSRVVNATR